MRSRLTRARDGATVRGPTGADPLWWIGFRLLHREVCVAKQEAIEVEGVVTEVLPDQKFRVKLQNDHVVLAYAAGRMSKFRIRVLVGDRVTVELSPYDLDRGRITYRHKVGGNPPPSGNQRKRRR